MRALGVLLMLCVAACGRTQIDLVSDARAGAQAYRQAQTAEERQVIADGIVSLVEAATADIPGLPEPEYTAQDILADPASWREWAQEQAQDPPPYRPEDIPNPTPAPADRLAGIGDSLQTYGFWAGGISLGLLIAALIWVRHPFILTVLRVATSTGWACAAVGSGMVYLAGWWWAVLALAIIGVAYYHRRGLMKYLKRLRDGA